MKKPRSWILIVSTAFALNIAVAHAADVPPLKLEKGTHVSILGNTLADRMQHDGYFESLIHKAFPQQDLTFRDLGFSGDEIVTRARSADFGTPDEWLTKTKTDVVMAFFGFNESFAGPAGLEKFKADLEKFIDDTQKQYYNGNSPARLVLFSPIAQEKLSNPNYPDPAANNAHLKLYTAAMAEVAAKRNVQFVDLFAPSEQLYRESKTPLTFNGIHLTEAGYKALAPVMFKSVFGTDAPAIDASVEKIRAAVQEKNEMWFSRYRTVDGYNVYGGRSVKAYQPGNGKSIDDRHPKAPFVSNFQVMQEEMSERDVMTANRDKRVWAVAQGGDLKVDDSNIPPVEKVQTNHPGTLPDGSHTFLGGQEAIKHMTVPKGVQVNLWASEEQFPELIKPVQMAWDTKGRLWVSAWRTYPERAPTDKIGDSILIFEDPGNVGHATKVTHFIDGLNCPTGFQFYKDGILLMQAPDLWYVKSTKGDDHADWKERVIDGLDSADSHHTTNSMVLDPGGATYLSDGVFHRTQVETYNGPVRNIDACIYRYEPITGKFERYVSYGFANPHGRVFDYWGNDFITDATGNANYFAPAFSGHIDYPAKHPSMQEFWKRPSRPCPGTGMISSRAWPDDFNGNFLNCNVIGFQGIYRVKMAEDGSGIKGTTLPDNLVSSDDPNFRPAQVDTGPDGAVYFSDWSNSIIGHLQHHLRDPNRDHVHGRIYRMTYEGRTIKPAKIDGQPIEALLALLKEPENDTRTRAKIELGKHDAAEVIAATDKWVASLDKNDGNYQHHLTEALWVHQWHNVVDVDLLKQVLRSPDPHARTAATRVLCYWRDRVPEPLALLKAQADDENPRVRLEAVRAASFFNGVDVPEAIQVAFEIPKQSTDYYLDYTLKETLKQLQNLAKEPVVPSDPVAAAYMLDRLSDKDLARAPNTEPVMMARLARKSYDLNGRLEALKALAASHKTSLDAEFTSVIKALDTRGASGGMAAEDLTKVLATVEGLDKSRANLLALTESAKEPGVRRAAWAAIAVADAKATTTWADAKTDPQKRSLVESIGLLLDTDLRETFQPMLIALISDAKTPGETRGAAMLALPLMGPKNAGPNFALLTDYLKRGEERTNAARAVMQLPRKSWDKAAAGPVAESILAWAKTVPAAKRTAQDFVETTQTGIEMASLLPPADATRLRKELRGLGVSVFVVKTVREQMRYDTTRLVVEVGKPFEVIMENLDAMPHNIVFVEPGARESVAKSVETMPPDKLDKQGRAYLPAKDKRVLSASKLVEPGQKETVQLTAPKKEGVYEYVCTFPGHWQMMYGTLVVTKDVDAYLQANPVAPVQEAPKEGAAHVHPN